MKLTEDCIRDILVILQNDLELLENGDIKPLSIDDIFIKHPNLKYSPQEFFYTITKLEEGGFLTSDIKSVSHKNKNGDIDRITDIYFVTDLTYKGHEYAEILGNNALWKRIQPILMKAGIGSVEVALEIAKEYIKSKCFT